MKAASGATGRCADGGIPVVSLDAGAGCWFVRLSLAGEDTLYRRGQAVLVRRVDKSAGLSRLAQRVMAARAPTGTGAALAPGGRRSPIRWLPVNQYALIGRYCGLVQGLAFTSG
ncbi:MAG: hypothetical protein IPK63_08405 [Candidatus Competibacteraceae bacterium]|nr:hypothetical protein [Candidatus Competibacteraceae bacterium]